MSNVRSIPLSLLSRVQGHVNKANNRAVKLGVSGFGLAVSAEYAKKVDTPADYTGPDQYMTMVDVTLTGPIIKLSGFELVGKVDFEDGLIIPSARPGYIMPVRYRTIECKCEHCNINRTRNVVYIFRDNEGKHIQVGRTCLQDFLGVSPEHVLFAASGFSTILEDIDGDLRASNGLESDSVALLDVLTAASYTIRLNGFQSVQYANDNGGQSTRDNVNYILFSNDPKKDYKPTADDKQKARDTIAYIQTWSSKTELSDYEYNAIQFTSKDYINIKRIGLVASLVNAYNKSLIKQVEKDNIINGHVGTIGKKDIFDAKYLGENWFDTAYGRMCIARFSTDNGLLIYKGSSPFWPNEITIGQAFKIQGTIKSHTEYKGTMQSIIQRCKIIQ